MILKTFFKGWAKNFKSCIKRVQVSVLKEIFYIVHFFCKKFHFTDADYSIISLKVWDKNLLYVK